MKTRYTVNMQYDSLRKQPFFYILIITVLILSYFVFRPFISAVVLAFLTALFFKPVYDYFHHAFHGKRKLASSISVIVVIVAVVIPVSLVVAATVNQIVQFNDDLSGRGTLDIDEIVSMANTTLDTFGVEYTLTVDQVQSELKAVAGNVGQFFVRQLPKIGSGAANFLASAFIYVMVLFFLFPIQDKFMKFMERLSPMDDHIDQVYLTRVLEMSKSMVKGTFLIAFVQAVAGSVLLMVVGVDYILFWLILMIFLGIIPVGGATLVLIPIGVVLLLTGGIWQGLFLIAASIFIISNIDNVMRAKLVSKKASLHPVLVLVGVLGGVQVFGMLGFIYGPVIMILLVTTVEMYLKFAQPKVQRMP